VAALAAAAIGPDRRVALVAVTLVAGGTSFPLYSLSNAHLNDYLEPGRVVAAGSKMILVNGVGSVAGPIVGAAALHATGPGALFVVIAVGYLVVAAHAVWRISRRAAPPEEERSAYVPLPAEAAPTVATLQEGVGDELYPASDGFAPADGFPLAYTEQGTGQPVVLVHPPAGGPGVWDDARSALAADGIRAVVPHLRVSAATDVERHVEDLLAVLRHLDVPAASFVGFRGGVAIVARLAAEHPERVRSLVVIGAELPDGLEVDKPVRHLEEVEAHWDEPERFADLVVGFLRHEGDVQAA
jgi:hypothetical protein